jgi:hypothetical protein
LYEIRQTPENILWIRLAHMIVEKSRFSATGTNQPAYHHVFSVDISDILRNVQHTTFPGRWLHDISIAQIDMV